MVGSHGKLGPVGGAMRIQLATRHVKFLAPDFRGCCDSQPQWISKISMPSWLEAVKSNDPWAAAIGMESREIWRGITGCDMGMII